MDFFALLALATLFTAIGYWLGTRDHAFTSIKAAAATSPDNPQDVINNLRGQVAAQRVVLQKWVDDAAALGFDGVHAALEHIRRQQTVVMVGRMEIKLQADAKPLFGAIEQAKSNIVSLQERARTK